MGRLIPTTTQERHEKSWGFELWVENCADYCGKLLSMREGGKTSMHFHRKKLETMFVIKGRLLLWLMDGDTPYGLPLGVGESVQIPRGQKHQLEAATDCEIIEFSTQHFEADSVKT